VKGLSDFLTFFPYCIGLIYSFWILFVFVKKPSFLKKATIFGIAFFIFFYLVLGMINSFITFKTWKAHPLFHFLLPPYNKTYFYRFCFFHYFLNFLISLAFAFIFAAIFFVFEKMGFVSFEEIFIIFLGSLISRWPNLIVFFFLSFLLALFWEVFKYFLKRDKIKEKIVLKPAIVISLLITAILSDYILKYLGLGVLKI